MLTLHLPFSPAKMNLSGLYESRLIQPLRDWFLLLSCSGWYCTDAYSNKSQAIRYICMYDCERAWTTIRIEEKGPVISSTTDGTWVICMPFTPLHNEIYRFPNFKGASQ